jgi:ubiquinone/menaquinone biosynthesis C-methylase UbiE
MTMTAEMKQLKAAHYATWAAGDYAAVAEALVQEVAEAAVAVASLRPGEEVLDVATGSGNAALSAARTGAKVTGLDLVPSLLDVARERARREGLAIEWVEGDAEALPYPDAAYDVALSVLGVQFVPRHALAAAELGRVIRPGGRLVMANWTPAGFIGRFFATIAPRLPNPPDGASPPPLWGDEDHLRRLFAGTGVELTIEPRSVVFEHSSPEGFVDFMAANYGPLLKARERLEPEGEWDGLRADLIGLSEQANLGVEGFLAPSEYVLAHGAKER